MVNNLSKCRDGVYDVSSVDINENNDSYNNYVQRVKDVSGINVRNVYNK